MLISLNWVRQHCPFPLEHEPRRLGEIFSLATAEVEGVEVRGEGLDRFVVARVLEVAPIPKAKKLRHVRVDVGASEPVEVVCGAPNVRPDLRVPFAAPGVTVGGQKLEKAKIFGVESSGMLLSEKELGLSDDHAGLLELDPDAEPGTSLDELFPGVEDIVLEVDNKSLTHRPDLWGHHGIAREFSTIFRTPLEPLEVPEELATQPGEAGVSVEIAAGKATERCRRYLGLRIDGVTVAPSPDWLKQRLLAVGSRPINNLVDITNYILLDLGQPLHAFDLESLAGPRVEVRMAREGETMTLLDGRSIELDPEDLLIADAEKAVALAGIMGGDGSQVQDSTTSIFLESANFEPTGVRRSSLRHGRTDSSARFEKSLDPEQARRAILRAARLVLDLCPGARVVGSLVDVGFEPPEPLTIETGPREITGRLGCDLPAKRVREILEDLGFRIEKQGKATGKNVRWKVEVPGWRATRDVSIPEDLVEEVGRIHGYDNIEPFAPLWPISTPSPNLRRRLEREIKQHLSYHGGLNEVLTYSMVGEAHCRFFGLDPEAHLRLKHPMNEEQDRLRREIVPLHLEKVRDNQRYFDALGFYEVGRVYVKDPDHLREPELPRETTRVAGVVGYPTRGDRGFYQLKYLLTSLAGALVLPPAEVRPLEHPPTWAHPGVAAELRIDGRSVGSFYRIHPDVHARLELKGEVLAFDLDFEALFEIPTRDLTSSPLPRFPGVPFDISVLAPEREPVATLEAIVHEAGGDLLRSVEVFDVYRGKGLDDDQKSVSLHLEFRSSERTLEPAEIETLQQVVLEALAEAGFPLR